MVGLVRIFRWLPLDHFVRSAEYLQILRDLFCSWDVRGNLGVRKEPCMDPVKNSPRRQNDKGIYTTKSRRKQVEKEVTSPSAIDEAEEEMAAKVARKHL